MRDLYGSSVLGSQVRVEPAKESFLDRLQRERASQSPYQPYPVGPDRPWKEQSYNFTPSTPQLYKNRDRNEHKHFLTTGDEFLEETGTWRKRKIVHFAEDESQFEEETTTLYNKKKSFREEDFSERNTESSYAGEEISSSWKKKNKVEEEILSSFKSFSSVWGDSDAEEDGEDTSYLAQETHKNGRYILLLC